MKKLILTIAVLLPLTSMAQSLFPQQPVDMTPGYGANGAGLHYGRPVGIPGNDCIINPVSMTTSIKYEDVTVMVPGDIITIPATVLFDFDKDFVRPEGNDLLRDTVFAALMQYGVTKLDVIGHTDAKGTEQYNDELGLNRAAAVATALVSFGFPSDGVTISSGGELNPIAPNESSDGDDNPEGRQLNRRVELVVKAVRDVELVETKRIVYDRNPQIFHRLSTNNTVLCAGPSRGDLVGSRYWFWQ